MKKFLQTGRGLALLAVVGCAMWGFSALFVRLRGLFVDPLEDMSFGWLVPIFSLYILWSERRQLRESMGAPSWAGLLACIPCALLALMGTRGSQMRFEQLGFIGLFVAVPWAFFGRRMAKRFLFPAMYLAFTIPVATFLDVVTIHLRLLASSTALVVLKGLGLEVVQKGTAIYAEGAHPFSIDVAEPCSGLRSLFALMALTAAYAWYTQPTWTRRALLFACSVPLAVLGNVTRILSICLVAAWANSEFALGFYHDYSGYVVFVVAISLMVACGEGITRIFEKFGVKDEKKQDEAVAETGAEDVESVPRHRAWVPYATALCLAPIFILQALNPEATLEEAPNVVLPAELPGFVSDDVRFCQNEQCMATCPLSQLPVGKTDVCPKCGGVLKHAALGELTVLPADTQIQKKIYQTPRGDVFLVALVMGGKSKSSIHRPELCMPAQGFLMQRPRDFTAGPERRPFHAVQLARPNMEPMTLAYTFFNQNGVRTSSHVRRILVDTWDRSARNRIDRWAMITVHAQNARSGHGFSLEYATDREVLDRLLSTMTEKLP